jgi:hypothetical protein
MYPLKQSTAITVPVYAHDENGDAVTGMVDGGFTKRISKNGAAFGAMTVTITEMENGWYSVPLGTGHSDTVGVLSITLTNASCKQINLQFRVHARILDDIPTVAQIQAEMEENGASVLDTLQDRLTAARAGYLDNLNIAENVAGTSEISGLVDFDPTATPVEILATGGAAGGKAADEIVDDIWDELKAAHTTPNSFGDFLDIEVSSRSSHGDPDPSGYIDAAISGRAAPGDAMDLVANAVDAAAIATGAIDADAMAAGAISAAAFAQAAADKVWATAARALTDKAGFSISGAKTTLDALNDFDYTAEAVIVGSINTDAIDAPALNVNAAAEIADKILGRNLAGGSDGTRTVQDALRALRNRVAIAAGTMTVYQENDTSAAWTGAVSTAAGDPISEVDPA